jgi:hypothetical protein
MIDRFISKDPLIRFSFWIAILLLIATVLLFAFFLQSLPVQVPLFYSKPWGQDQLAKPLFLMVPLVVSVVFFLLNVFLTRQVFKTQSFVKNVLTTGAVTAIILATITTVRIILLIQ